MPLDGAAPAVTRRGDVADPSSVRSSTARASSVYRTPPDIRAAAMTGTDRNIPTTPATSPPVSRRGMDPASHDEGEARVVLDSPTGFAPVTLEVRPAEGASYPVGRLAEEQEAAWIGEVSCVRIGIEAFRPHGLFTVSGGMMLRRGREGGQRRSAPERTAQARRAWRRPPRRETAGAMMARFASARGAGPRTRFR